MADKEIYIGVFISHETQIDGLNFKAVIPPGGARIYTRAVALKKMAKAINKERCRPALRDEIYWETDQKHLLKQAAAALAALLGEHK